MAVADVTDWMDQFGKPGHVWYAKRLSANDTLANQTHQAGPYIPKEFLFEVFPSLLRTTTENTDHRFDLYIDSHADHRVVRAIWYNNKVKRGGTRNEARLTGFGGQTSALLDPESTGALAVFAFVIEGGIANKCHVWVCRDGTEEDLFEERLGPIEPRQFVIWRPGSVPQGDLFAKSPLRSSCRLAAGDMPSAWLERFPSGEEIIRKSLDMRPPAGMNPDVRLLRRRQCEYEIFLSIEEAVYMPRMKEGFRSLDGFLGLAQTILQSRKSRSGNSLELHVREIMTEEGLRPGIDFVHRPVIEKGKRPDFVFPSVTAYEDSTFPPERLRMLAAKTTCKDRWRQVINEANRIPMKHLLTLQEGVSASQFMEMREAGVQLVVPSGLHNAYPNEVRPHLVSFENFIGDIRLLSLR